MYTFVPTIKFRLAVALGVPALLTLGIGAVATAALRDSRWFFGLSANALLWLLLGHHIRDLSDTRVRLRASTGSCCRRSWQAKPFVSVPFANAGSVTAFSRAAYG